MRWERLSSACLSEYRMDRHLLCLEQEAERRESEAHLAICSRCQQEMAWLHQERADLLAHPSPPLALQQAIVLSIASSANNASIASSANNASIALPVARSPRPERSPSPERSPRPERSVWSWSSWTIWASVATCSIALFLSLSWKQLFLPTHTIYRGADAPVFLVGLKRGAEIRQMLSGEAVKAGDHIRLAYQWRTEKPAYLYVIHRDQVGRLSPLYPDTAEQPSLRMNTPNETTLPGSLEFDRATHGHEEIWACFSRHPVRYHALTSQLPVLDTSAIWEAKPHGACAYLFLYRFRRSLP